LIEGKDTFSSGMFPPEHEKMNIEEIITMVA
jgi:hypothetical protein